MIREFLLDALDDVDDYKALGAFASAFPSAIDAVEWETVSRRMRASFIDWSGGVWDDAEQIWGLHSDIEEIGRGLGVDVYSMLVELQERASQLEDEEERTPVNSYSSSSAQSSNEVEEIHALFASLPKR